MRKFLADTFALITLSLVVGVVAEVLISGLTLGQSLQSRITGTVLNLLTGGLYGRYRDWLFQTTGAREDRWKEKMGVGMLAFLTFQVPLYVGVLWSAGATGDQMIKAVTSVTLFFAAGISDYYLSLVRRWFGVSEKL